MNTKSTTRRILEIGALILIGEGVMGLIKPRWYSLLWNCGPKILKTTAKQLAEKPDTARLVYLAEAAIGVAIALNQTPDKQ